ncbi:MAG: hypothetical protein Q8R55_06290 [Candidatus Taylorbacteria bacterium]|nr:hypothetical protein [Candidatus Taylorbacteria bacterium]
MKKIIFLGGFIALSIAFVPTFFSLANSGSTTLIGGMYDGQVVEWSRRSPMIIYQNELENPQFDEGWLYHLTNLGEITKYNFIIYRNGIEVRHCNNTSNCYYDPVYDVTLDDVFTFYIQGVLQETFSYDRYAIQGCTDDEATNHNPAAEEDDDSCVYNNTSTGSNIIVEPLDGITLTFTSVSQEGQTIVTTSTGGPPPPTGFKLGTPETYYSITTTAQFNGSVEVCVTWTEGQFSEENNLKFFHSDGTNWNDITGSGYPDTVNNVICGLTDSFSDFAVFEKKQVVATIDIKPGSYPNSINPGSNGNVPVAIFSTSEFDATTLDPLTVELAGAPVELKRNGTPQYSFRDVNNDGLVDIVVHIRTEALQLTETDELANFIGYTSDNTEVIGSDAVRVVP